MACAAVGAGPAGPIGGPARRDTGPGGLCAPDDPTAPLLRTRGENPPIVSRERSAQARAQLDRDVPVQAFVGPCAADHQYPRCVDGQ
jgi:hypothetical protein